jgi:predicted phosphatase
MHVLNHHDISSFNNRFKTSHIYIKTDSQAFNLKLRQHKSNLPAQEHRQLGLAQEKVKS